MGINMQYKNFSDFLKKKPLKKRGIVAVVGTFDPPTVGYETVFNEAARYANHQNLPLRIYFSEGDTVLTLEERISFSKAIFPRYQKYMRQVKIPGDKIFQKLDEQFKRVVVITNPTNVEHVKPLISENYQAWDSGPRDPGHPQCCLTTTDQMFDLVKEGNYDAFATNFPSNTEAEVIKILYERLRVKFDLPKKSPVIFERNDVREEFYSGVFQVGDSVQTNDLQEGTITEIGANFISVQLGEKVKRYWPKDIIKM